MGFVVPNFASSTEDRASGAQVIDGSLKFDSSKEQYLSRTPSSVGNRRTWTWSGWLKLASFQDTSPFIFGTNNSNAQRSGFLYATNNELQFYSRTSDTTSVNASTLAFYRDYSAWYHIVLVVDTTESSSADVTKIYVNGVLKDVTVSAGTNNYQTEINNTVEHAIGRRLQFADRYIDTQMSQVYFIDGQALGPEYFGYTDALTNTWRPKKLDITETPGGSWGTNGFYLPFDGSAPIGEDKSGNGNNWTPVNFGGSTSLEKATGALPILNTDGGGKFARVGVRTDADASSLVLALPLVGSATDVSNQINSGSSTKTITNTGVTFVSNTSNLYGGSAYFLNSEGDFLSLPYSSDFDFTSGDFTIEGWIYHTANVSDGSHIFGTANGGTYSVNINVINHSGYPGYCLNAEFNSSSPVRIRGNAVLPLNTWIHFAVVKSGSTISLYQDGVFQNSTSSASIPTASGTVYVGRAPHDEGAYKWNGYIQDFRVYKGVAKYTSNFIPASTDPDILPDTPSGVSGSSKLTKITDGAVSFDGASDYLNLGSGTDYNVGTGDFTFECFAYYDTRNNYAGIFGPYTYSNNGLLIQISNSNVLRFVNPDNIDVSGTTNLSNRWVHIAVTRSGTTLRGFVNGVQEISTTYSSSIDFANGGAAVLGVTDVSTYL